MSRFAIAIKAFFRILSDQSFASAVTPQLTGKPVTPAAPVRNDALTLLAALQREARLVDFLMEPINTYGDAQIGAAVRDIHDKSAKLIADYFAITPLLETKEGDPCTIPAGYDPIMYHVTGTIPATAPFKGTLRHPGWRATQCKLPQWTGKAPSALVVAPAEVEC
jgi:hypothetical protein